MSASGQHVLAFTLPEWRVIGLNGNTVIPTSTNILNGGGLLSASGNVAVGTAYDEDEDLNRLVRVSTSTGELEVLGEIAGSVQSAYANPDASAVVGWFSPHPDERDESFFWSEDRGLTFSLPGVPESLQLMPGAVSADGSVIAGSAIPGCVHEFGCSKPSAHFRWTEADGYVELAYGDFREATLMSRDGSVVLGVLDPEGYDYASTFRWTKATGAVELVPGVPTYPVDMSDDGNVVVTDRHEEGRGWSPVQTLIWDTAHGTRTLEDILEARGADTTGWEFTSSRVLSGDGKVLVGQARCGDRATLYRVVLSD